MTSSKKIRSSVAARTEPGSDHLHHTKGSTPEQRIADLEYQLAEAQLNLAAANRQVEMVNSELQTSRSEERRVGKECRL